MAAVAKLDQYVWHNCTLSIYMITYTYVFHQSNAAPTKLFIYWPLFEAGYQGRAVSIIKPWYMYIIYIITVECHSHTHKWWKCWYGLLVTVVTPWIRELAFFDRFLPTIATNGTSYTCIYGTAWVTCTCRFLCSRWSYLRGVLTKVHHIKMYRATMYKAHSCSMYMYMYTVSIETQYALTRSFQVPAVIAPGFL